MGCVTAPPDTVFETWEVLVQYGRWSMGGAVPCAVCNWAILRENLDTHITSSGRMYHEGCIELYIPVHEERARKLMQGARVTLSRVDLTGM